MWRKQEEQKASSPSAPVEPKLATQADPAVTPRVAISSAREAAPAGAFLSKSLTIKGEITGAEDLYIDGEVYGQT
jgi:hypothetical protein